jgi:hypothetical protein
VCSLAEVLDRILQRGVALEGNLTVGVANVDLLYLDLRLLLAAVDTVWPEGRPPASTVPAPDQALPPPRPPSAPAPDSSIPPSPAARVEPFAIGGGGATPPASSALPPAPVAGLVRLVLTLVKLLHDVLERQAVRRMDGGHLTVSQIEDVGTALLAQAVEIEWLRQHFGLADRDLSLKFGLSDRSLRT